MVTNRPTQVELRGRSGQSCHRRAATLPTLVSPVVACVHTGRVIQTIKFEQLALAATRVGVTVTPAEDSSNLYVWHTPEQEIVYIGKSASGKRTRDEIKWREEDPRDEIRSGIITLLRANHALLQPLGYEKDSFDPSACRARIAADGWSGPAIEKVCALLADRSPTAEEVEQLLIRICVRYGVPLGNSQFASQWETPIGSPIDTMAAISVYADDEFRP